jgi:hypothetical protein
MLLPSVAPFEAPCDAIEALLLPSDGGSSKADDPGTSAAQLAVMALSNGALPRPDTLNTQIRGQVDVPHSLSLTGLHYRAVRPNPASTWPARMCLYPAKAVRQLLLRISCAQLAEPGLAATDLVPPAGNHGALRRIAVLLSQAHHRCEESRSV